MLGGTEIAQISFLMAALTAAVLVFRWERIDTYTDSRKRLVYERLNHLGRNSPGALLAIWEFGKGDLKSDDELRKAAADDPAIAKWLAGILALRAERHVTAGWGFALVAGWTILGFIGGAELASRVRLNQGLALSLLVTLASLFAALFWVEFRRYFSQPRAANW